jgi:hypothetical protein
MWRYEYVTYFTAENLNQDETMPNIVRLKWRDQTQNRDSNDDVYREAYNERSCRNKC